MLDASKVTIELEPTVKGLPDSFVVEYFGKIKELYFIIARPRDNWGYDDFVVLMSNGLSTESIKIIKVTRYRDGGTTNIQTEKGDFYFPTPFESEKKATFKGEVITVFKRR